MEAQHPNIFEYVHPCCWDLTPDHPPFVYETNKQTSARIKKNLAAKRMHYKAAASWIAQAMRNPNHYGYTLDGHVKFNADFMPAIYDNVGTRLVWIKSTTKPATWVGEDLAMGPVEIGQLHYLSQTMLNVLAELRDEGRREATPTEIEKEFGLSAGTVRKYIHDHREHLLKCGAIRQADGRTMLCRHGWAIMQWGRK